MIKNKSYRLIIALIVGLIFADPPNWDSDGDGVLDNYNDYQFNSVFFSYLSNNLNVNIHFISLPSSHSS